MLNKPKLESAFASPFSIRNQNKRVFTTNYTTRNKDFLHQKTKTNADNSFAYSPNASYNKNKGKSNILFYSKKNHVTSKEREDIYYKNIKEIKNIAERTLLRFMPRGASDSKNICKFLLSLIIYLVIVKRSVDIFNSTSYKKKDKFISPSNAKERKFLFSTQSHMSSPDRKLISPGEQMRKKYIEKNLYTIKFRKELGKTQRKYTKKIDRLINKCQAVEEEDIINNK